MELLVLVGSRIPVAVAVAAIVTNRKVVEAVVFLVLVVVSIRCRSNSNEPSGNQPTYVVT